MTAGRIRYVPYRARTPRRGAQTGYHVLTHQTVLHQSTQGSQGKHGDICL